MQRFQLQIGARTLVARCDPALHHQAESVLRLLGILARQGALHDGARIQLGWSQLAVRARDQQLVVCAPQFDGDPMNELSDDITTTLSIVAEQAALAQQLGVAIQPTSFAQRMVVACGALERDRIYLERQSPADSFDSGWYIAPSDEEGEHDCEHMRVFELLRIRPALVRVLGLPSGHIAAFDGDELVTVLDPSDRDLLAS